MSVLNVVHTTTFEYSASVGASYNEARLTPSRGPGQRLIDSRVTVSPHTWMHDYVDYWGTTVTAFEVLAPHQRLTIVASSLVDLPDEGLREPGEGNSWDFMTGPVFRDMMAAYLSDSATTQVGDDVVDLARRASRGTGTPDAAAQAVCRALRDELEYVPGVTTVHSVATEAWEARKGVCQDVSHLCLGALRAIGIPARYVSGYLHPARDAAVGQTVEGESHAWIEWWAGGWRSFDPTNRAFVQGDHVVLGRGRDYDDVAPLKGVYAGTATSDLDVKVEITRRS